MSLKVFKIRDKATGMFWNGSMTRSVFNETGSEFKNKARAENAIAHFVNYRSRWSQDGIEGFPTDYWEIVEFEMKPVEKTSKSAADYFKFLVIKAEAAKVNNYFPYFLDAMYRRKAFKDIEFLIRLKPAEGSSYVDFERIKEARAQLRQLGVKTGSFRETNGVFGMMDRQQAMRARLVLDVEAIYDLSEVRKKLGL